MILAQIQKFQTLGLDNVCNVSQLIVSNVLALEKMIVHNVILQHFCLMELVYYHVLLIFFQLLKLEVVIVLVLMVNMVILPIIINVLFAIHLVKIVLDPQIKNVNIAWINFIYPKLHVLQFVQMVHFNLMILDHARFVYKITVYNVMVNYKVNAHFVKI